MSSVSEGRALHPATLAGIRAPRLLLLGSGALILALAVGFMLLPKTLSTDQYVALGYYPLGEPRQVELESLQTHRGTSFLTDDLKGHWSLLFFGYSYCPDICPTTLGVLNGVAKELSGPDAPGKPQIVMITVDPGRDSAAQLADYVPFFNSEFIGVTGGVDALSDLAAQLNVAFQTVEPGSEIDSDSYLVAHGSQIVVVDPRGHYTGVLTAPHEVERVVKVLTSLMRE